MTRKRSVVPQMRAVMICEIEFDFMGIHALKQEHSFRRIWGQLT